MTVELIDLVTFKGERFIVKQCCVCKRWMTKDGSYQKAQDISLPSNYVISHIYCPSCVNIVKGEKR